MPTGNFIKRVLGWILALTLTYAVFIFTLGAVQKYLMYFPDPATTNPVEWALKEMQPFEATTTDGLKLTSWYVAPRKPGKFTIVFFQGNNGHLGYRNYKVRPWIEHGYGVLMVGYRGFGNPGSPSEQGLYTDGRAAIDALKARGTPDKAMVLYGESLGTGVAVQMATEYDASGIILESPFTSTVDVAADRYPLVPVGFLLRDKYESIKKIKDVHMPLLLMHGEADQVVPVKFGKMLFEAANEPKQAEYFPDVGHYDVYNLRVQQLVLTFLAKLPNDALLEGVAGGGRKKAGEKKSNENEKDRVNP